MIGGERDYVGLTLRASGDVRDYAFVERTTAREDVHVMWWDDGSHGAGSTNVSLPVPAGTIAAWRYTQVGDSTSLDTTSGNVSVPVSESAVLVYFDDGFTPAAPLEPLQGPRPGRVTLAPPTPSPSFGAVRIAFGLPVAGHVSVQVFDVAGRRVTDLVDATLAAGTYRVTWDGRAGDGALTAEGVYLVRLVAGTDRRVEKLVRLR